MTEAGPSLNPDYLAIARILTPFGVHGEMKAEILTDFPERFAQLRQVWLGDPPQPFVVQSARLQGHHVILGLEGITTPEAARKLARVLVQVPLSEAVALSEGQYYWHQIIGLRVHADSGEDLGTVSEILQTGSNDVYVVQGPMGEVLIPAIESVVESIDLDRGEMTIRRVEGLY